MPVAYQLKSYDSLGTDLTYLLLPVSFDSSPVLRKNSMPLPSQRDVTLLHSELSQAAASFPWLETLLIAEVYSPDRIFADQRFQREDGPPIDDKSPFHPIERTGLHEFRLNQQSEMTGLASMRMALSDAACRSRG